MLRHAVPYKRFHNFTHHRSQTNWSVVSCLPAVPLVFKYGCNICFSPYSQHNTSVHWCFKMMSKGGARASASSFNTLGCTRSSPGDFPGFNVFSFLLMLSSEIITSSNASGSSALAGWVYLHYLPLWKLSWKCLIVHQISPYPILSLSVFLGRLLCLGFQAQIFLVEFWSVQPHCSRIFMVCFNFYGNFSFSFFLSLSSQFSDFVSLFCICQMWFSISFLIYLAHILCLRHMSYLIAL